MALVYKIRRGDTLTIGSTIIVAMNGSGLKVAIRGRKEEPVVITKRKKPLDAAKPPPA